MLLKHVLIQWSFVVPMMNLLFSEETLLQCTDLASCVRLLKPEHLNTGLELIRRIQERLVAILQHSTQVNLLLLVPCVPIFGFDRIFFLNVRRVKGFVFKQLQCVHTKRGESVKVRSSKFSTLISYLKGPLQDITSVTFPPQTCFLACKCCTLIIKFI